MRFSLMKAALLGLGTSVYAQSGYVSATQSGITYAFSVPSSGSDVYIKLSGPTSLSWIGVGSGSEMAGSKMFIIYTNSAGTNVTLSPRSSSGHSQPTYDSSIQATLADGTGVSNGVMTAVIKCSNCASQFQTTSSSAPLIYAAKSGSALNSDSTSATISRHDNTYGTMTLDMTQAKNANNVNPFGSGSTPTTSNTPSCVPISQASSGSSGSAAPASAASASPSSSNGFSGFFGSGTQSGGRPSFTNNNNSGGSGKIKRQTADSACPSGYTLSSASSSASSSGAVFGTTRQGPNRRMMLIAHGVMASLAFVLLFPFGAISIRLLSFPGLIWFHAALQIFAYAVYIVAFGLGIWLATQMRMINEYHPVIGIILFVLIFFMPILGWLHHSNFKKFQRRTLPSHAHVWLGRGVITLGIINGGLGLKLANNTRSGEIAYGIIAGTIFVVYLAAIVIGERRRAKNTRSPPKYDNVSMENAPSHSSAEGTPRTREFYAGQK